MEPLDSLVRAAQEGDAEVFNRIVERFQDMACASAYAMIEDVHLAEDVAQEAFLEAYLNVAQLREPAAFASWFRRIIRKQADRLTRGKCLTSSPLEVVADVPTDSHSPPEIAETNDVRVRIHCAISALPERERMVIVLFYGTGYALKDIAAFLEVPVTTVKKRLYDARQRLKDKLVDVARDVLQEQRPSITGTFPAKVRLLIAARLGDIDIVKELLARSPMLLNMKAERGEASYQSELSVVAGMTALHEAAMYNHAQLAQMLCEYGASPLREMVRDIEAEERVVMLFEQTTDAFSVHQRLMRTAMTIAAHFDGAGHEVLLVVDHPLVTSENMADVHFFAAAKGITSLLFVPMNDLDQPANSSVLNDLDVQWWFSRARAKHSLWPAIDPLASRSRVLESSAVRKEHRQVAERVRDVLLRYHELREQTGSDTLSEEDRGLLARGERIDLFLTQPFVVAEAYTDLPGAYLTIEETISSFRDLLDGRYDAVPAQSFSFVGRIEQG